MGDLVGDRALSALCLPGTHDSGAYRLEPRLAPPAAQQEGFPRLVAVLEGQAPHRLVLELVEAVSLTQRRRVSDQLRDGIRLFDLRVCAVDGAFRIHHGLVGPRLGEVLDDVAQFLAETEREVVVIRASHFAMGPGTDHRDLRDLVVDRLGDRLLRRCPRLPHRTIDELTRGGSAVLWFHEPDDGNRLARDDDRFWPSLGLLYRERWCRHARDVDQAVRCQQQAMAAGSSPFHLWWTLTPKLTQAFAHTFRRAFLRRDGELRDPYSLRTLTRRLDGGRLRDFLARHPRAPLGAISVDFYDESEVVAVAIERSLR